MAYACLMKDDYEHACSLAENLFDLNEVSPQSLIIFVQIFFERGHLAEGFNILDKVLSRLQIDDPDLKNDLRNNIQSYGKHFDYKKYPHIQKFISTSPFLG